MRPLIIKLFFIFLVFISSGCSESGNTYPPLNQDAVILAFGDSLTAGYGSPPEQSYPALLQDRLQRTVINAGISGEVSAKGLSRLPVLLNQYQPDLVILCHGGNDILRRKNLNQMKSNILQMIDLIRQTGAEVMLLAVPKPSLTLSPLSIYQQIADETRVIFNNNLIRSVLTDRNLKADSIHPNAAGNAVIAEEIEKQFKQLGLINSDA